MKQRQDPRFALCLLPVVFLAGCVSHDMTDLESYVARVKSQPPGPIEPLPEIQPIDVYVYEPGDRRDPFTPDEETEPTQQAIADNGLAPDPTRRKEELESQPLDSLRMVGTLDLDDVRWALIRTNNGILHRVKVGNYLGMNNGQITSISDDQIQLTEIVSDAPGQWRERPATIALTQ
ncbi:Pilus assembly protein PilP [Thiorhodococcus drewsii AZ1]|uniref:Pilus assembly protein PilP n=1 Tax=Thiorhodococcus drewsii AZ1 TaxID=765913 RepID=G2E598_9GAMM|nr:pilus assembly protein PilP [Thiorhodococcus drewsii]EGV29022.1 Pilus assembly protein PilP [Thiorhodococcus drewsii AZ1]